MGLGCVHLAFTKLSKIFILIEFHLLFTSFRYTYCIRVLVLQSYNPLTTLPDYEYEYEKVLPYLIKDDSYRFVS